MTPYRKKNPESPIESYDIQDDSIHVRFNDKGKRTNYLYTNSSTGTREVEAMKRLAKDGRGLATYITTTVQKKFYKKW